MAIISLSLPEETLDQIDLMRKKGNYRNRSELIRTSVKHMISCDQQDNISPGTKYAATVTLVVPENMKSHIHEVKHTAESIIKTEIHQCLSRDKCMIVFVLEGRGRQIRSFAKSLEDISRVENVSLSLAI